LVRKKPPSPRTCKQAISNRQGLAAAPGLD